MEVNLNSPLKIVHISKATEEAIKYIEDRRSGLATALKTRWKKLNNALNGGITPGTLTTLGGCSGSGKSSFANSLQTDIIYMNPKEDLMILDFSFEMKSSDQVGRKLSYHMYKTTTDLYSGKDDEILSEEDFNKVKDWGDKIKKYPIYYVDVAGTVADIKETIEKFCNYYKDKWVVVFLDHALLTKGKAGDSERQILSELQTMFIEIKKKYKISIIQLSQLNRDIESKERIVNPQLHFPQRSDLFASDSLYHASDFVMIIHRPEILSIYQYGVEKWPTENLVYLHLCKNRSGELKILCFKNQLKFNRLEEHNPYDNLSNNN